MAEIVRPVTRKVTIPAGWNHSTLEPTPERTFDEPTGWIEVVADDGLRAAARTEEGARGMLEKMRMARAARA